MFIVNNFLHAVALILDNILGLYKWIVIISALLSWVNPDPYNPIIKFLRNVTEPVFYRVRRWLPFTYVNGVDLSPIVVILAVWFLQVFLVGTLMQLSVRGF
jgi:YggT family protein